MVQEKCHQADMPSKKKPRPRPPETESPLCLCLLSRFGDGFRKHTGMTRHDQRLPIIVNKAFVFQLMQLFSETCNQTH